MSGLAAFLVRILTGVCARWEAEMDSDAQRIYYANHSSNLDFLVIWSVLPPAIRRKTRPVAARDYWEKTRLRRFVAEKVFNAVLIERKNVTRANNPLVALFAALDAGSSLIIFPEGGRFEDEIRDFKSGIYHLCKNRPALELVPVYVQNLNRILPKGEVLPIPLLTSLRGGKIVRMADGEERNAFLERTRNILNELKAAQDGH